MVLRLFAARAAAVVSLVALGAQAQTAAVSSADLSRGTTLLPGSSAWADEATAAVYNPAGLARVGGFNAWYLHERSNTRSLDNDALFLAAGLGDIAGLGLSFEWLRAPGGALRAKTGLSLAAGPEVLSLGLNVGWWHGGPAAGLVTADVGVQSRPTRWLSLGLFARNLNTPSTAEASFGREYTVGVGLRPWGERLTVGVDWLVPEARALAQGRLQYTVQASVIRGLRLLGGVSHGFEGAAPLFVHAGLGVDLEQVGYTQGVAFASGQANWQFALRASSEKHGSIVPKRSIAVISLADVGAARGSTLGALLGLDAEDRFLRLLRFLERAARDPELAGVVLKVEGAGVGLARADELRAAVVRLRAAGKKVYAYVLSASDADYLAVSACDGIYAAPEAMLLVDGLRSSVTLFGGAAEQLGVHVDVARVGPYKSAPEQFTRRDMSDAQREALTAYLDTSVRAVAERVTGDRRLTAAAWQAGLDEGLKPARRAKALGQLDGVVTPDELDALLREQLPGASVARGYRPFEARVGEWGRRPTIAVIPVLGNITGGRNTPSPFGGELIAGAESFIAQLGQAADDPSVKAIVVRVDSGGGDGLASDLMYRAVLKAKKKKPVIASMGDVAASGGYYVAMGADRVFASPTTLTGSIGVFFIKPAVKQLAETLGVRQESVSRGKLAGITDLYEPWTDAQREAAQRWVDDFYDSFITEVAASRTLDKAAVHAVAQGRVWSGADAQARGLVDALGGFSDALAEARTRAGLGEDVDVEIATGDGGLLRALLGASAAPALLEQPVALPSPLPPMLQELARKLGPAAFLVAQPALQARLEYLVEID
jgi:protease-4